MTDAKDEVFCRLALRQGFFTKDEALGVIRAYRQEARTGQDIGDFVTEQGWMEEAAVQRLNHAIAQRAPGHVAAVKRRVPKAGGGRGGGEAAGTRRHPHHVAARPAKVAVNPTQLVLISIGGILLLGCVIFLVFEMQKPSVLPTVTDRVRGVDDPATTPTPTTASRSMADEPADLPGVIPEWTADQLKSMEQSIEMLSTTVKGTFESRPVTGLDLIDRKRKELGPLPPNLAARLEEEEKTVRSVIERRYTEMLGRLRAAKEKGEGIDGYIEDIVEACGPEYRARAEKEQ